VILADENIPESVLAALEAAGISVTGMSTLAPGALDDTVLAEAVARNLIVSRRTRTSATSSCSRARAIRAWCLSGFAD
jgi:hypothetical protein